MKGNASKAVNVDSSASALEAGKVNYALNGFPVHPVSFVQERVDKYVRNVARKNKEGAFDVVVVDPSPPPLSLKSTADRLKAFYIPLFVQALKLLKINGMVLYSVHGKVVECAARVRFTVVGRFV